mgnify:FL=1
MRAEEKNMVERIMDTETMGYAYEYPYGGGARKEYMLALTPENLANFIGARGYDAKKIVITDVLDRLIVNTCMGMLDVCPDQKLCGRIIEYLGRSSWERRRLERFWRWNAMWQMNILLWKMKRLRWQNVRCYRDC